MIKMVCILRAHDKCLTKMCKEKYLKTFESYIAVNACSIVLDTSALLLRYLAWNHLRASNYRALDTGKCNEYILVY